MRYFVCIYYLLTILKYDKTTAMNCVPLLSWSLLAVELSFPNLLSVTCTFLFLTIFLNFSLIMQYSHVYLIPYVNYKVTQT